MRVLLTGGAGFIGSHVADAYIADGQQVYILDDFSTGREHNLPAQAELIKVDLTEAEAVRQAVEQVRPRIINHHAAQISVVNSVADPVNDARRNIIGTINLLEAARGVEGLEKVIYASSGGAMYGAGAGQALPFNEATPADPMSPYGLSKNVAERYVWLYAALYGLKATVLRYANVYGPRQDPHGEAGVCAIFTQRLLDGQPVKIFGDGSQLRDYIFVGDIAAANVAALTKGVGGYFNIATGRGITTREVFQVIKGATGYSGEAEIAPARPGEVQAVVLSPEAAKQGLGWQAKLTFEEGIAETVAWYRQKAYKSKESASKTT